MRKYIWIISLTILCISLGNSYYRETWFWHLKKARTIKQWKKKFESDKNYQREKGKGRKNFEELLRYAESGKNISIKFSRYKDLIELFPNKAIIYIRFGNICINNYYKRMFFRMQRFIKGRKKRKYINQQFQSMARKIIPKAIKLDPDNALSYYMMAQLYFFQGQDKKAVRMFLKGTKKKYCQFYDTEINKIFLKAANGLSNLQRKSIALSYSLSFFEHRRLLKILTWHTKQAINKGHNNLASLLITQTFRMCHHIKKGTNTLQVLTGIVLEDEAIRIKNISATTVKKYAQVNNITKTLASQKLHLKYLKKLLEKGGMKEKYSFIKEEILTNNTRKKQIKKSMKKSGLGIVTKRGVGALISKIMTWYIAIFFVIFIFLQSLIDKEISCKWYNILSFLALLSASFVATITLAFHMNWLPSELIAIKHTMTSIHPQKGSVIFIIITSCSIIIMAALLLPCFFYKFGGYIKNTIAPMISLIPKTIALFLIINIFLIGYSAQIDKKEEQKLKKMLQVEEYQYIKKNSQE